MDRYQILNTIRNLARSQGFYGRLLRDMTDEYLDYLEEQNFADAFELVIFLEE